MNSHFLRHPKDSSLAFCEGKIYLIYRADATNPPARFADEEGLGFDDPEFQVPACVGVSLTACGSNAEFLEMDPEEIEF